MRSKPVLGWKQAAIVFATLALLAVGSYALLAARESPRRAFLREGWSSVQQGQRLADVLRVLGQPDETEAGDRPTCARRLAWRSDPGGNGDRYTVCVDGDGRVRDTSHGIEFNLTHY